MQHRRHSGLCYALGSSVALIVQATVVVLILGSRVDFASCSNPGQDDLENNPELQKYQDGTMILNTCTDLSESCSPPSSAPSEPHLLRVQCTPVPGKFYLVYRNFEEDPIFGGTAKCVIVTESNKTATGSLLTATYKGGSSTYSTSLTSSPGYDVKNVLQLHAEGPACSLYIFGSDGLPKDHTCCDFVFDVLCGASPKYKIYDDSCEK